MRNLIPLLLLVATALAGCQSPQTIHPQTSAATVTPPALFHPMLVTTFGTNATPDGTWRIGVSEASLDLSRSAAAQGEGWTTTGWTTTSLSNADGAWRCHAGWFVFTESESRVWAYDGDRNVHLLVYTSSGKVSSSVFYDSRNKFPCAVPAEVFSRLSESAQKMIQSHD